MQPIDRAQAQQRANDILVFQRELQRSTRSRRSASNRPRPGNSPTITWPCWTATATVSTSTTTCAASNFRWACG